MILTRRKAEKVADLTQDPEFSGGGATSPYTTLVGATVGALPSPGAPAGALTGPAVGAGEAAGVPTGVAAEGGDDGASPRRGVAAGGRTGALIIGEVAAKPTIESIKLNDFGIVYIFRFLLKFKYVNPIVPVCR